MGYLVMFLAGLLVYFVARETGDFLLAQDNNRANVFQDVPIGRIHGRNPLGREIDLEIARTKLDTLGVAIDSWTPEQKEFLRRWQ